MKFPPCVWIVAAIGLLAGCQSVQERRISTHQEAWSKLSEEDRYRLIHQHLRVGDTEEMVLIALGPPDKVTPITSVNGQKQTRWFYDDLKADTEPPYSPDAMTHFSDRSQNVVFQDGIVVDRAGIDEWGTSVRVIKSRAQISTERMVTSLDLLVTLTPEQRVKANSIFLKANEALDHSGLDKRGPKGTSIRKEMSADVRAILTAAQREKYDDAPPYMGGASQYLRSRENDRN
ncbi:MAG TPA: hypothetical protein VGM64_13635 [Lacunisphaera sp.]|jgi:hypothetical protein